MKTQSVHSYGVLPVHRHMGGELLVLLIRQKDPRIEYWTFPKGRPEEGESPRKTARRELAEETGILNVALDPDFEYIDSYDFLRDGVLIKKSVTYFLGMVENTRTSPQLAEVDVCEWVPFLLAREKLTYDGGKKILDALETHIERSRLFGSKSV